MELSSKLTRADREFLERRMGALRYVPVAVPARTLGGQPVVVFSFFGVEPGHGRGRSIRGKRVWTPTLFWLVDEYLHSGVARLESAGGVQRMQSRIEDESASKEEFLAGQGAYRSLVLNAFREHLPEVDPERYLTSVQGIGGVSEPAAVKCLHAHLAHFIAKGRGVVGKWVAEDLDVREGREWVRCIDDLDQETPEA